MQAIDSEELVESSVEQLVERAQSGNLLALEQVCVRFEPLVRAVAGRYRSVSHEDALQEGWLALLGCVRSYQPDKGVPFAGFAALKVRGDVRTAMRRIWRQKVRTAYMEDDAAGRVEIGYADIGFVEAEWNVCIQTAGLSERERVAVAGMLQGKSVREIGEESGVSTETVKTWRKRAFRKLRVVLREG